MCELFQSCWDVCLSCLGISDRKSSGVGGMSVIPVNLSAYIAISSAFSFRGMPVWEGIQRRMGVCSSTFWISRMSERRGCVL